MEPDGTFHQLAQVHVADHAVAPQAHGDHGGAELANTKVQQKPADLGVPACRANDTNAMGDCKRVHSAQNSERLRGSAAYSKISRAGTISGTPLPGMSLGRSQFRSSETGITLLRSTG